MAEAPPHEAAPADDRRRGLGPVAALGAFALMALLLFAPALLGGRLFVPLHTDPLLPWRTHASPTAVAEERAAGNPELSDKLWLFHPDTVEAAAMWRRGELPTWNRTIAGGVPFLGQALYGLLYPPNLLLLIEPLERAYAWSTAFHVVAAALGAWWLARRLRFTPGAALYAGVLFAASGPLLVRYHYYMTFFAAVWVPWLLAAVHAFAKAPSIARLLAVPLPIALIVLSGFPQTGLYGVLGAAVFGALLLLRERRLAAWRPLLALALSFGAGVALAGGQIAPVDAASRQALQRPHDVEQQIREAATWPTLLGYALPGCFMDSREPWSQSFGKNPLWNALYARVDRQADGSGQPVGTAARPSTTESTCYAGALAIGLLLAAFATRWRATAIVLPALLLAALVGCWSYALGVPWIVRAVASLPRFDMGEVRRILPTTALLSALLAALGAQRFLEPTERRARRVALAATLLIALAAAALALQVERLGPSGLAQWFHDRQVARYGAALVAQFADLAARTASEDGALHDFVRHLAWRAAAWFGGGALVLALAAAWVERGRQRLAITALALFALADLGSLHFRVNPFLPADHFAQAPPLLAPLAAATSGGRVRRYAPDWRLGDDSIEKLPLPPNLGALFGIEDGDGYLVQLPVRYARWLRTLEPETRPDETVVTVAALPLHSLAALRSPLLTGSSVRHLLSRHDLVAALAADGGDVAGWRETARDGELRVFENERALPFAFVVPQASFLPPPPSDDAIGTTAEGFVAPIAAAASARAQWHAALLAKLANGETSLRDRAWFESERPSAFSGASDSAALPLDDGTALPITTLRLLGPPSQVVALARSPARIEVTLDGGAGGFLVVNEGFDPGWQATVDGAPAAVVAANVAWRGVVLPTGARHVVLDYRPVAVRRGLWLTAGAGAAWLLLALAALVTRARGPRQPAAALAPARAG